MWHQFIRAYKQEKHMIKTILLGLLAAHIASPASATVVKGYDDENSCELYRVALADSNGKIKIEPHEVVIFAKEAYGLSFQNMEVNFDKREVLVQPMINVLIGFNRPLINTKAIIAAENPEFYFLINHLNRKLSAFEKICISNKKIIYAKMFQVVDADPSKH